MEEETPTQKQKNPSQPKPDGIKLKAIKWKKNLQIKKQKYPLQPKPDGPKPKTIK